MAQTRRRSSGFARFLRIFIFVVIFACMAWSIWDANRDKFAPKGECTIHFIDIGQGDAALIITDVGSVSNVIDLIYPKVGTNRDNYDITTENGTLTIVKAAQIATAPEAAAPQPEPVEEKKPLTIGDRLKRLNALKEQGLLSDGDVLILDEPEVRLHPEWQIVFAELMVLLCKTFDLRILLTSHSVDFIHALSLFVRKYKLSDRLRLYRSKVGHNGSASIDLVPNNEWERLFDTFVRAIDILAEIRDSLPEDD